jgi:tRNA 2-selenouridine synthase
MIRMVETIGPGGSAEADEIIDVRSPSEFDEDHVPGALNLPVLSDAERALVGTMYVQDDPFRARRLGAALVSRNIALHLEGPLAGRGPGWRPLVYCWRGGQRSGAMATVLSQIGWRTAVLSGGYKTYRRSVVRALYDGPPLASPILLGGPTGVGKTELLACLAARGVQVVDLEDLAGHRGSLLGAVPERDQPSQKMFESRLAAALAVLDGGRPVLVEAEASRIGEVTLPPMLWAAMRQAPVIELTAPIDDRVARLVASYGADGRQRAAISEALGRLPRHISRAEVERWRGLLDGGALRELARELVETHYDPAYLRSAGRQGGRNLGAVALQPGQGLDHAADRVQALLGQVPVVGPVPTIRCAFPPMG